MAVLGTGGTLVARVARQLSALSLEYDEGTYLGAEDVLLAKLGVSRPTLRQAAKIVEAEHMITVRRGIRGGFYAARPNIDESIRQVNRYLRLRGVTLREMGVINAISEQAAGLAAQCEDEDLRGQLAAMLDELGVKDSPRELMEFDTRYVALISRMSSNPVVEVLIAMSYSFGMEEQGIYLYAEDEQKIAARRMFREIGEAVLARDEDLARFMMRRRLKTIRQWIDAADPARLGPTNQMNS